MSDMFGAASQNIPDNIPDLFSKQTLMSAIGEAGKSFSPSGQEKASTQQDNNLLRGLRIEQRLSQGVVPLSQDASDVSKRNAPGKTEPAATVDPITVEQAWMARLAKFAGISQATGVKLGSTS